MVNTCHFRRHLLLQYFMARANKHDEGHSSVEFSCSHNRLNLDILAVCNSKTNKNPNPAIFGRI